MPEIESQLTWYDQLEIDDPGDPWALHLQSLLRWAGNVEGEGAKTGPPPEFDGPRFIRPRTILFDGRIRMASLMTYEERQQLNGAEATVEQFKVFFNELYAAALLASILHDSAEDGHPWEFYADFSRHFWDETRHSEFGAVRLRELGQEPSVCDPRLFEKSESLPVLHRICYLTRGLESFFMPRKQPRVREYESRGDHRSQLFADQDWSDEITHVRYGSTWCDHLLEGDFRTVDDVLGEVRQSLAFAENAPVAAIGAPF